MIISEITTFVSDVKAMNWTVTTATVENVTSRQVRTSGRGSRRTRTVYDISYSYEVDGDTYVGELIGDSTYMERGFKLSIRYNPEFPAESAENVDPNFFSLIITVGFLSVFVMAGFRVTGWRVSVLPSFPSLRQLQWKMKIRKAKRNSIKKIK